MYAEILNYQVSAFYACLLQLADFNAGHNYTDFTGLILSFSTATEQRLLLLIAKTLAG